MRRLIHNILLASALLLTAGCHKDEKPERSEGALVTISGVFSSVNTLMTKAGTDLPTADSLSKMTPVPLPEGTTLYLLIEKRNEQGVYEIQDESKTAYVITGDGATLYPCTVDDDGNLMETGQSPLLLREGNYRFHVVSPARKLESDYSMKVHNGQYILASDDRYDQTAPKVVEVKINPKTHDIQYVNLNPLINQTAQIRINLKMGENVSDITVLPDGVEISGLHDDSEGVNLKWTMNNNGFEPVAGNRKAGVRINDWEEHYYTEDGKQRKMLTGKAAILPTDATTSTIFVMFNISVNGVPTQYMSMLHNQLYKAAHSYEYNYSINIEHGITVGNWDNITIVKDLDFSN